MPEPQHREVAGLDGPGSATEVVWLADRCFLRGGDAAGVLVLRLLRATSLMLVSWGVAVGIFQAGVDDTLASVDSTDSAVQSLTSPFALLSLGILLRVVVAPLAFGSALLFVVRSPSSVEATVERRGRRQRLVDGFRLVGACRGLRWTNAVRDEVVASLGRGGRAGRWLESLVTLLWYVGWVAVVVAAIYVSGSG